jgi:hypothetical protein
MKEYVVLEVDNLNKIHYKYETLYFTGITLDHMVKEILYRKYIGARIGVDV